MSMRKVQIAVLPLLLVLVLLAFPGRASSHILHAAPPVVGVVFPQDEDDDAWVVEVDEDGPAAKAGVKAGDTITKINSMTIKSVKRFREVIKDHKAGDVVKLTVRRGKEFHTLSVTLGERG